MIQQLHQDIKDFIGDISSKNYTIYTKGLIKSYVFISPRILITFREKTPKKDCVLFARVNHENKFMFRGTILNFNKEILQYITTSVEDCEAVASKTSSLNQCIICLDQSANCAMYPCGHIILCVGCKQNYERQFRHCSLCKKEFTVCFRVYLQNH